MYTRTQTHTYTTHMFGKTNAQSTNISNTPTLQIRNSSIVFGKSDWLFELGIISFLRVLFFWKMVLAHFENTSWLLVLICFAMCVGLILFILKRFRKLFCNCFNNKQQPFFQYHGGCVTENKTIQSET